MAKLFNKIRQKLVSEKPSTTRTTNYLKYAIGEIVLVVIGILIALSINNWNSKRIQKQKENLLLSELNKEFKGNKVQLDTVLFNHKRSMKSVEYLLSRLPIKDIKTENLDSLSYHLWHSGYTYTFNPSSGATNSIMNSSTIDIISNDELRQLLVGWNDMLLDYQEEEILAQNNYQNQLKPFEKKHFYYSQNYKNWLNDSRIDLSIFQSLEFDNYVQDRQNDLVNILNNTRELDKIVATINKIIELSETK
ncbi:MAG: hypothetical protein GXO84_11545, partial [Chlorobi bacterium]|nr:hypothetical protein [Chlorobiota bacterium]